jgi:hypothetical protein
VSAPAPDPERVTVGRSTSDSADTEASGRATYIFNDDRLTE